MTPEAAQSALFGNSRGATFSVCRRYRYRLNLTWGDGQVLWVLLNPSTADAMYDDPTSRRVWTFTDDWGYRSAEIVNLFAWRATDPGDMRASADPVGPKNDEFLRAAAAEADLIVCGWGAGGRYLGRDAEVAAMLRNAGHTLHALGFTRTGEPRHPLYLPRSARPVAFGPAA